MCRVSRGKIYPIIGLENLTSRDFTQQKERKIMIIFRSRIRRFKCPITLSHWNNHERIISASECLISRIWVLTLHLHRGWGRVHRVLLVRRSCVLSLLIVWHRLLWHWPRYLQKHCLRSRSRCVCYRCRRCLQADKQTQSGKYLDKRSILAFILSEHSNINCTVLTTKTAVNQRRQCSRL